LVGRGAARSLLDSGEVTTQKAGTSTQNAGTSTQNAGTSTQNAGTSTQTAGINTQKTDTSAEQPYRYMGLIELENPI